MVTKKLKGRPPRKTPAPKSKHRQAQLPNVMTGPEVRAALGGVSHVTVHHLYEKGHLRDARIGKAKQQGGGWLWNRSKVEAFAKGYKPQPNHRKKTRRGGRKRKR